MGELDEKQHKELYGAASLAAAWVIETQQKLWRCRRRLRRWHWLVAGAAVIGVVVIVLANKDRSEPQ